jgi:hypothetical protein
MRAWAEELVARVRDDGVELTGNDGLLTALVRRVPQNRLAARMTGSSEHGQGADPLLHGAGRFVDQPDDNRQS